MDGFGMTVSGNSFAKKTVPKSSNVFVAKTVPTGSESFSKKPVARGTQHGWTGDNVTDAERIEDLYSSSTSGVNEPGGLAHFKNRTAPPDIAH